MDDEIDYAEMLEIPVETVTVRKRESRKPRHEAQNGDLSEQLVAEVNERMEGADGETSATEAEASDPNFAESKQIERSEKATHRGACGGSGALRRDILYEYLYGRQRDQYLCARTLPRGNVDCGYARIFGL